MSINIEIVYEPGIVIADTTDRPTKMGTTRFITLKLFHLSTVWLSDMYYTDESPQSTLVQFIPEN